MRLWLRQMGIAAIALVTLSLVLGLVSAGVQLVSGPVALPAGPLGGALQLLGVGISLLLARRLYLVMERRDAAGAGRLARG